MAGELDDPLLMQSVGRGHAESYKGAGHNGGKSMGFGKEVDDSTMGIGGMGEDEESHSIRNIDIVAKKKSGGFMTGIEDSELTNNVVGHGAPLEKKKDFAKSTGISLSTKEKKKDKKSKDKKKKKDKKHEKGDSDD